MIYVTQDQLNFFNFYLFEILPFFWQEKRRIIYIFSVIFWKMNNDQVVLI